MAEEGDYKFCNNCKKNIASANFVMHEVHCRRHIILCNKCQEPIPRSEEKEHFDTYHALVQCDMCDMSLEKDQLEYHKKQQCLNKPGNCEYCDIEMPSIQLREHEEYCGTRTEPCINCNQYVMIRDFSLHLESGCEYPTPKPKPQSSSQDTVNLTDFYGSDIDPFSFEEIHRLLDEANVPSLQSLEEANRFQALPHSINNDTNENRARKNSTNRRSEVNKMNGNTGVSPDLSPPEEVSHLFQNYERLFEVPSFEENGQDTNGHRYADNAEDDLLPCEFCGEPFPIDIIIQHQSGCDPLASSVWTSSHIHLPQVRNNDQPSVIHRSTAYIPVINNLQNERVQRTSFDIEEDYINTVSLEEDNEEVMLPCEFCTELFPTDSLVIHQSVCDANTTITPRVKSPAVTYKSRMNNVNRPVDYTMPVRQLNISRSSRHQQPPTDLNLLDSELSKVDNCLNDPFSIYNRRDINKNILPSKNIAMATDEKKKGTDIVKKSSRRQSSSKAQETLNNLLHERNSPTSSNGHDSSLIGAVGGTSGINDKKRKKPVTISSKRVVQELQRNDDTNDSSINGVRSSPEEKKSSNRTTRQRSTHLLNADTDKSRTKASGKSKNIPRR